MGPYADRHGQVTKFNAELMDGISYRRFDMPDLYLSDAIDEFSPYSG